MHMQQAGYSLPFVQGARLPKGGINLDLASGKTIGVYVLELCTGQ